MDKSERLREEQKQKQEAEKTAYLQNLGGFLSGKYSRVCFEAIRRQHSGFVLPWLQNNNQALQAVPLATLRRMCTQLEACALLSSDLVERDGKKVRVYTVVRSRRWDSLVNLMFTS